MKKEKISTEETKSRVKQVIKEVVEESLQKQALEICKDFIYSYSTAMANVIGDFINKPTIDNLKNIEIEHDRYFSQRDENEDEIQRMFTFGDTEQYMVQFFYIFSVRRTYREDGKPCLMINEIQEGITLRDNPIRNLVLMYDNEAVCCRDFDRLRNRLNKWKKKSS